MGQTSGNEAVHCMDEPQCSGVCKRYLVAVRISFSCLPFTDAGCWFQKLDFDVVAALVCHSAQDTCWCRLR